MRVEGTVHQPWNLPGVNLVKNPSLHFQSEQVQVCLARLSWGLYEEGLTQLDLSRTAGSPFILSTKLGSSKNEE